MSDTNIYKTVTLLWSDYIALCAVLENRIDQVKNLIQEDPEVGYWPEQLATARRLKSLLDAA